MPRQFALPRRPPGVHPGHPAPGRHQLPPLLVALPGRDHGPHPALLGRRLRELHHQPERHGPPLAARADARLAVPASRSTPWAPSSPASSRWSCSIQGALVAAGGGHHPLARGHDALHPAPVPPARARSSRCDRDGGDRAAAPQAERVVIPVPGLTRAVVQAVNFGRAISDDVDRASTSPTTSRRARRCAHASSASCPGVPFVIVESPLRSLVQPFVAYLDVTGNDPEMITIVVLPEYVGRHWWDRILYNQLASRLRRPSSGGRTRSSPRCPTAGEH